MKRLADKRIWLCGGALVALLVVALSWFTLIAPELSSAHDLRDQTAAAEQQNEVLTANEALLKAKSAHLSTYTSSLRKAVAGLPYGSGLPAFTRQVNAQARAHQVKLSSITVSGVTPVVSPTTAAAAPTTRTAAGTLFSVQVSLQSIGSLEHQLAFLEAVRVLGPRRVLITATQVAPGTGTKTTADAHSSLATQLTIFVAPRTPDQVKQLKKLLAGDLDG